MIYRKELDGLRAIALLPVMLFHAGFQAFSGGFAGVDIFFVISGYLITAIILNDIEKGTFSLADFYERRARRILPALFFVMLVCAILSWFWLLPSDMLMFAKSVVSVNLGISNFLFWAESGYFDTSAELKPLLHTWSLSVEEQFYLIYPILLLILFKVGRKLAIVSLGALAFVSLALAQIWSTAMPDAAFFLVITRGWELLIGSFVAYYRQVKPTHNPSQLVCEALGALGMALCAYSVFAFSKQTPFPSLFTLAPTLGAALIILFSSEKTLVGKLLGFKFLTGIGLISFSAYLWHQPVFAFSRHISSTEPSQPLMLALILLSLLLAFISWRYIERPFRNKSLVSRNKVVFGSISAALVFLAFGVNVVNNAGYPNRFSPEMARVLNTKDDGRLSYCLEEKPAVRGPTCHIGATESKSTIAVVGDSHATRITATFSELLKKNGKSAVVYAQSWCPPLIDVATDNPHKYPSCREYRENTFQALLAQKEIKTVFLIAEWASYTQGLRLGGKYVTFYTDAESTQKSMSENVAVVARGLDRTIKKLNAAGKRVILVKTVPEYSSYVPYTMAKNYLSNGIFSMGSNTQTKNSYNQRNNEFNEILKNIVNLESIYIMNTENLYCSELYCEFNSNANEPFYFDGSHLTRVGSTIISKKMIEYVNH